MKKLLITGAGGQLGNAAREFFGQKYRCIPLLRGGLDITDKTSIEAAFEAHQPDIVLNCAAMTNVDGAETELSETAYAINRNGPANLAEACRTAGCVLVHISTDYVFDGSKAGDYTEEDEPNPQGVYGLSKLEGERAIMESGCKFFILRTAWLYGHHGNNFLKTMLRLGKERGAVSVVTDQRGNPTTTRELCRIIEALLTTEAYGLYHATCRDACTWNEFAREIFKTYGLDVKVSDVTSDEYIRPAQRPANSALCKLKLERISGYTPNTWQECLREYFTGDVEK